MNLSLTPVRFLRHAEQQFPHKTAVVCQGPHSIEFCDSLPKTEMEKVVKRELHKKYEIGAALFRLDAL
jgi:acyl-coenzyme A synthetase/AMP-(fatty) acid ligase